MQIVHNLGQVFLGLVLSGHVREFDAIGGLDIDLGAALSGAEHHGVGASGIFHHAPVHKLTDGHKDDNGQHPGQQEGQQGVGLLDDLAGKDRAGIGQRLGQIGIGHHAGLIDDGVVLVGEDDLILLLLHLHLAQLLILGHLEEGAVVHLLDLPLEQQGHGQEIEQQQHQQYNYIIVN